MENPNPKRVWSVVSPIFIAASATLAILSFLSVQPTVATGPAQASATSCLTTSTLENLVSCIHSYMPASGAGFVTPTSVTMAQWSEVVAQMMEGSCNAISLSEYDWGDAFTVTTFTDDQNNNTYCVFMETQTVPAEDRVVHGWGTFIYNDDYLRELNISAPHAKYETGTATETVGIFKNTGSRTFLMTGAHRQASLTASTCQTDCMEGDCRQSDAAHNTAHMFHATIAALKEYYDSHTSEFYHLQFHGMGTSSCPGVDVYITHGMSATAGTGDKILELKSNLLHHNTTWTVTVPGDSPLCTLHGSTNVQGRLLNGVASSEVCAKATSSYSGRFIHIEQKNYCRDADDWIDAIKDTWAFTVSGTVTCEGTGPISDVEVFVWNRETSSGFTGDFTDSSGTYSVTLEEGNYDLIFNPLCGSGCASQSLKGITVPPNQIRNITLTIGHSISGTVFATDGTTPVSNVAIYAFNRNTAEGFGLPLTNADGHYCIGLVTGTYELGFTPPPCLGLGPKTEIIAVTKDMTRNIALPPGFTVAGRITDEASNPVPGVQIYARECYTWTGYGFSPSNVSGYYTGTLPIGTFGIQFLPLAGLGLGPKIITDVTSTTAGCPNTSLNVTLPEGFAVSGKITCRGEPVKNVFVYADPAGPSPDCYGLDGVGLYTVDDGSYRLPVVPGTYDIKLDPPPATEFETVVISDVQVITDTALNFNLCPFYQWLPILLRQTSDALARPSYLQDRTMLQSN
jgi:hypothetical protein